MGLTELYFRAADMVLNSSLLQTNTPRTLAALYRIVLAMSNTVSEIGYEVPTLIQDMLWDGFVVTHVAFCCQDRRDTWCKDAHPRLRSDPPVAYF